MLNVKYFDNPYEFNPSRFNSTVAHPFAFAPFSGGPRNCIGQHMSMMEVRITLAQILNSYRLELSGEPFQMIVRAFLNTPMNHHLVKFIPKKAAS
jgi:cytochrome P450